MRSEKSLQGFLGDIVLESEFMPDNVVSVKTISRREMTRNPAVLNKIQPGETAQIEDRKGGLLITRAKTHEWTPPQVMAEIERVGEGLPALDADKVLGDDE